MLVIIHCYTDGSCKKNGKTGATGGYGVVVVEDGKIIRQYQKFSDNTTNNREELKAIIWATLHYPKCVIHSDSQYAINVFQKWMYGWERNNWIKSDNKVPENLDLIKAYYQLVASNEYQILFEYVKGHNGDSYNEMADKLATGEILL